MRDSNRAGQIVTVGYELMDVTRRALLDGSLTLIISHPLDTFARAAIAGMTRAAEAGPEQSSRSVVLNFDIFTRENI